MTPDADATQPSQVRDRNVSGTGTGHTQEEQPLLLGSWHTQGMKFYCLLGCDVM